MKRVKFHRQQARFRSLRRPSPTRLVKQTILIVCEDSKASPDYFDKLRKELQLPSVNVEICGEECGSAPINVVDFAKMKKLRVSTSTTKDSYDKIFCISDVDDHVSLRNAIQKARDNDLQLIISNPCFEYWYILHFEKTGQAFSRRQMLYKKLEQLLGKPYNKRGCEFFKTIHPLTNVAIANAKAILNDQWHDEKDLSKCNPSSHVYQVVEYLLSMK